MKIDGAIPRGRETAMVEPEVQPTSPAPVVHPHPDDRYAPQGAQPRHPLLLRGALSALRYSSQQSVPATRVNNFPPGASSPDSQLVTTLEKGFDVLHPFLRGGQLTQSALQHVAAQEGDESDVPDRTILAAREVLKRPRLNDAIMNKDGYITRDSLSAAATHMTGNSAPSAFSQDPFHSRSNAQVVQAFQDQFEQLRDKTRDRTVFFEKYQYVEVAALKAVTTDPDAADPRGLPVLERSTGLPKKKYSEHTVYTARNIIERPGLLRSLERATSNSLFGRSAEEGWLSNKSLERWLKQDKEHKAR